MHFIFFTLGGSNDQLCVCAGAVALCTTAISKHGGGRRQCCETVSLSLFTVRVKRAAIDRLMYNSLFVMLLWSTENCKHRILNLEWYSCPWRITLSTVLRLAS